MATTPAKKPAGTAQAKAPTTRAARPAAGGTKAAAAKVPVVPAKAAPPPEVDLGLAIEKVHVEVKLKDLIERVTAATGAKKGQVRVVVEAVLKEMGTALAAAQGLNLPGLGKMRVVKMSNAAGSTMTLKLRRAAAPGTGPGAGETAGEGLAEPGEDS